MSSVHESWLARLGFSIISLIALLGNTLVLWVYIKKRKTSIKAPFDVFIINLAVTDLVTAIFLVFSRFLYLPTMPDSQPGAFLLCNILWGGYILFGLGYVSVYTCLVLTIERWLALMKPHLYRRIKTKHAILSIVVVWIWAFLVNSTVFVSVRENFQQRKCEWVTSSDGKSFIPFLELSVSCVIPFSIIIILYSHIYYKINHMVTFLKGKGNEFKKRLTIIAFVASIALIVGWLPTKISYILRFTSVGGNHLYGPAHFIFIMMALGNSCVNPILYGIYSSRFRNEYKEILFGIVAKKCLEKETDFEEQNRPIRDSEL